MAVNKVLEAALQYQSKGQYVLPMNGKTPMMSFADKPALTEQEIKDIWQETPMANLALRTVDFFVIDIDVNHVEGVDGMKSLEKFGHDDWFKDTLTQRTASGGLQIFYKKPKNIEVRQNIGWLEGVDVKAHINNYVVVAPSSIKGSSYEWIKKIPMSEPDPRLLRAISKEDAIAERPKGLQGLYQTTKAQSNRTANLFHMIATGLGDTGGRNNSLSELMGGLLYRDVAVEDAIYLAEMANNNTIDPLSEKEFTRTVESMLKKETRRRMNG
ncbi:hypothetical protein WS105_0643 [Weissella ceti]|uniref:bifunctional DNA primase/polymerase n=1 Tax=Weissella ceti TaxID=759620 RepID=UPI0004F586DE|nr:bifunctional DNA primase/polymerase [Weissella ceti]AIM64233.1 hypothetical protein WS105_0643 [Weissella ceti]